MNESNKLKEINEYYCEELRKALAILWYLRDDLWVKHKMELPENITRDIVKFTDEFFYINE